MILFDEEIHVRNLVELDANSLQEQMETCAGERERESKLKVTQMDDDWKMRGWDYEECIECCHHHDEFQRQICKAPMIQSITSVWEGRKANGKQKVGMSGAKEKVLSEYMRRCAIYCMNEPPSEARSWVGIMGINQ